MKIPIDAFYFLRSLRVFTCQFLAGLTIGTLNGYPLGANIGIAIATALLWLWLLILVARLGLVETPEGSLHS